MAKPSTYAPRTTLVGGITRLADLHRPPDTREHHLRMERIYLELFA